MGGKKPQEYKGVAKFLAFLSPEIQVEWHTTRAMCRSRKASYELTRKSGFYDKNPGTDMPDEAAHLQDADQGIPRACASAISCRIRR